MHHSPVSRILALWIPLMVAVSAAFLFAYWAIQQNYRLSLNDPQVQMAEDSAAALGQGTNPQSLVQNLPNVDLRASLAPWVTIYDSSGTPIISSGSLDGSPPQLPTGVFDMRTWRLQDAQEPSSLPETRFSWQPRGGVRQAVTLVQASNGDFVAAGRNLREVENRVSFLTFGAALAWGGAALSSLILISLTCFLGWL